MSNIDSSSTDSNFEASGNGNIPQYPYPDEPGTNPSLEITEFLRETFIKAAGEGSQSYIVGIAPAVHFSRIEIYTSPDVRVCIIESFRRLFFNGVSTEEFPENLEEFYDEIDISAFDSMLSFYAAIIISFLRSYIDDELENNEISPIKLNILKESIARKESDRDPLEVTSYELSFEPHIEGLLPISCQMPLAWAQAKSVLNLPANSDKGKQINSILSRFIDKGLYGDIALFIACMGIYTGIPLDKKELKIRNEIIAKLGHYWPIIEQFAKSEEGLSISAISVLDFSEKVFEEINNSLRNFQLLAEDSKVSSTSVIYYIEKIKFILDNPIFASVIMNGDKKIVFPDKFPRKQRRLLGDASSIVRSIEATIAISYMTPNKNGDDVMVITKPNTPLFYCEPSKCQICPIGDYCESDNGDPKLKIEEND